MSHEQVSSDSSRSNGKSCAAEKAQGNYAEWWQKVPGLGFVLLDTLVAFSLGFRLSSSFPVEWQTVTGCPVPGHWVVWSPNCEREVFASAV